MIDQHIKTAYRWARKNVAIGTLGTILVGAASYVGELYYRSYYDFYFIDGDLIKIPAAQSIATFVIILLLSSALVALVMRSGAPHELTRAVALEENIPLFVLLFLLSSLAVDFYWSNVEAMSSWLAGLVKEGPLLEKNRTLTPVVVHFLRRALLIGPLAIASIVFVFVSISKFSFARFVMAQPLGTRTLLFAMFVLLALSVAGSAGRAVAFLEFAGVLNRPEIVITYPDGGKFDGGGPIYLVARTDSVLYVSRKLTADRPMTTWLIPQGAVRHVEFRKSESESSRLLDYFK